MLKIISNGKAKDVPVWVTNKPGTIEDLKEVLSSQTLDPTFEKYGNFINRNPQWLKDELKEKYKNCAVIFGNFFTYSHVFNIITDDEVLINEFQELITKNMETKEYLEAKEEIRIRDEEYQQHVKERLEKYNKKAV